MGGIREGVALENTWSPDLVALHAGDASAWRGFFERLYPVAWHATDRAGLAAGDREEVASDALREVAAMVSAARLQAADEMRGWVYTTARRRAISRWRTLNAAKRDAGMTVTAEALTAELTVLTETSPARLGEMAALLRELLAAVEPLTRELIEGHLLHGFSYGELAERHALPLGTVGVKLARGLTRLRAELEAKPVLRKEAALYLRSLLL